MGLAVGHCRTVQAPIEHQLLSMQSMDVAAGHSRDSDLQLSITLAEHWCRLQSMDLAAVLRRLPHSLQRCPEVKFALQAHGAATLGDGLAFARLHSRGTWMQQAIMLPRLQQACSVHAAREPEIAACILSCACPPGCM